MIMRHSILMPIYSIQSNIWLFCNECRTVIHVFFGRIESISKDDSVWSNAHIYRDWFLSANVFFSLENDDSNINSSVCRNIGPIINRIKAFDSILSEPIPFIFVIEDYFTCLSHENGQVAAWIHYAFCYFIRIFQQPDRRELK